MCRGFVGRGPRSPPATHEATAHHSFRGSFSAVSTPICASKYSFFSIFQDLQDLHTFAPVGTQIFEEICPKFSKFCEKFFKILKFLMNFCKILTFERRRIVKIL